MLRRWPRIPGHRTVIWRETTRHYDSWAIRERAKDNTVTSLEVKALHDRWSWAQLPAHFDMVTERRLTDVGIKSPNFALLTLITQALLTYVTRWAPNHIGSSYAMAIGQLSSMLEIPHAKSSIQPMTSTNSCSNCQSRLPMTVC
jgi:hypothetical protein